VGLPQSGAYAISPDPPSISSPEEGSLAKFDLKTGSFDLPVETFRLLVLTSDRPHSENATGH
jgi:hypothetical protein